METMSWPKPLVVASLRHPFERCVSRLYHAYIDQEQGPSMEEMRVGNWCQGLSLKKRAKKKDSDMYSV